MILIFTVIFPVLLLQNLPTTSSDLYPKRRLKKKKQTKLQILVKKIIIKREISLLQ